MITLDAGKDDPFEIEVNGPDKVRSKPKRRLHFPNPT